MNSLAKGILIIELSIVSVFAFFENNFVMISTMIFLSILNLVFMVIKTIKGWKIYKMTKEYNLKLFTQTFSIKTNDYINRSIVGLTLFVYIFLLESIYFSLDMLLLVITLAIFPILETTLKNEESEVME